MTVDDDAPAVARAELEITASPEVVWSVLADVERWPSWHPDVKRVEHSGDLVPGSEFRWKARRRASAASTTE